MKILHVISSLITGGAEKLVLDSAIKYNLKGIQVDVLLLWDNNHDFTKKLVETGLCKVYILNESPNIKDVYSLRNILKIQGLLKGGLQNLIFVLQILATKRQITY